jgi:hypothetical protein
VGLTSHDYAAQYDRLHRLFETACGLEPQQRSALLDRECAGDPTMRREVEALLARDRDPTSFLEWKWKSGHTPFLQLHCPTRRRFASFDVWGDRRGVCPLPAEAPPESSQSVDGLLR